MCFFVKSDLEKADITPDEQPVCLHFSISSSALRVAFRKTLIYSASREKLLRGLRASQWSIVEEVLRENFSYTKNSHTHLISV